MNKYLYIGAGLLVVGLMVYLYIAGRAAGKRKGQGSQAKLPNSGKGVPVDWSPNSIVAQLHNALSGISGDPIKKQSAFSAMLALTADQMTAVYNEFNRQFQGGPKGDTLYKWIKDEWYVAPLLGPDYRPELLAKMELYNLKKAGE